MSTPLTRKQKGFVKDYIKTGNGEVSARNNYDVANDNTARSIASENLTKPNIKKAIADAIPDELLTERHLELLNKREIVNDIDRGPDVQAVTKALDMGYKIKGTYAPEKNVNVNVELESDEDIKLIADQLNALHSRTNQESDGVVSDPMDSEVQNKE